MQESHASSRNNSKGENDSAGRRLKAFCIIAKHSVRYLFLLYPRQIGHDTTPMVFLLYLETDAREFIGIYVQSSPSAFE